MTAPGRPDNGHDEGRCRWLYQGVRPRWVRLRTWERIFGDGYRAACADVVSGFVDPSDPDGPARRPAVADDQRREQLREAFARWEFCRHAPERYWTTRSLHAAAYEAAYEAADELLSLLGQDGSDTDGGEGRG